MKYVFEYKVISVVAKFLSCQCELLDELWDYSRGPNVLNPLWAYCWSSISFDPVCMKLVTPAMCAEYPVLISKDPQTQMVALQRLFPGGVPSHTSGGK